MNSFRDSYFARALQSVARVVRRFPNWFIYPQIILFAVCVGYTWHGLKVDLDRDNLVGGDKRFHRNYLEFKKEFPSPDFMVVVVESDDLDRNRQFVERLAARIQQETNLFSDVLFRNDPKMLGPKGLLFVPESDLKELRQAIQDMRPFLNKFTQATNLTSLFSLINRQIINHSSGGATAQDEALMKAIPALQRIITEATASLRREGTPPSPGVDALFGAGEEAEQQIYLTFDKGRMFLIQAWPKSDDLSEKAVKRMRELITETQYEVRGLNVGLTGGPVLDFDEMTQATHDSILASIVSLVICSLLFIYAYRQIARPLKAVFCLVIGLGYTMGFTTLVIGHLNVLTVTFAPMLIGLGIDFGIHYITRFEEEMRRGRSTVEANEIATVCTGQGIVTGALTTAGAFLAMAFTNFKGIQEMGVISGGGLVLCLVPMMTLLPILLTSGQRNKVDQAGGIQLERRSRIERLWLDRPLPIMLGTAAVCVLAAIEIPKVTFDYDLLHMQSKGLPAVAYEKQLVEAAGTAALTAAVVADNAEEAKQFEAKIAGLSSVSTNISMTDYLTEDPTAKLELIRSIKDEFADIKFAEMDSKEVDPDQLSTTLYGSMGLFHVAADAVQKSDDAYLVSTNDLKDLPGLVQRLRRHADPVAAFLWSRLTPAHQEMLWQYPAGAASNQAPSLVVQCFNDAMSGGSLYTKERFQGVPLRTETAVALAQGQNAANTNQLRPNRMLVEDAFPQEISDDLESQFLDLRESMIEFRKAMLSGTSGQLQRLTQYQQALFRDLHETFDIIRNQDTSGGMRPADLPPALRNQFIGVNGKYLLQVGARKNLWERQNQAEFIEQLRSVVPPDKVTGTPVQLYEYTGLLRDSYQTAALYALIAIAIMVFLHFRSVTCVLLALLPVAIGTLWLVGFMGLAQIQFNPANIMTLPLVIGIGVTNGIQVLNRFAEELTPDIFTKSTGKSVLVSGLASMTGFGCLILAKHQGIQSLGYVMSIGIAACMIVGLTFLPALLQFLIQHGWSIRKKK